MTATETSTGSSVVLEFVGGPYDGKRLAVDGEVLRFGSGDGCTVRLRNASVPPVWFEILREPNQFAIAAHAAGVAVNGNPVERAELSHGDQITAGPICFRLAVAGGAPPGESDSAVAAAVEESSDAESVEPPSLRQSEQASCDDPSPPTVDVRQVRRSATQRVRRLIGELRQAQKSLIEEREASSGLKEQVVVLRAELTEAIGRATASENQIDRLRQQMQEQIAKLQAKLGESEEKHETLLGELDGLRESLRRDDAERVAKESAASTRVLELEKSLAEAHGERERLLSRLRDDDSPSELLDSSFGRDPSQTQAIGEFADSKLRSALASLRRGRGADVEDDDAMPTQMLPPASDATESLETGSSNLQSASLEDDAEWRPEEAVGADYEADDQSDATAVSDYEPSDFSWTGGSDYEATAVFESEQATPGGAHEDEQYANESETSDQSRLESFSAGDHDSPQYEGTVAWNGSENQDDDSDSGELGSQAWDGESTELSGGFDEQGVQFAEEDDSESRAEMDASTGTRSWLDQEDEPDAATQHPAFQPTSVLETLRKLHVAAPGDEGEEEVAEERYESTSEATSSLAAEDATDSASGHDAADDDEDDVSIEDYMQRLIARSGGSAAPKPTSAAVAPTAAPVEKPKPKPKPARPRRRAAPEATTDLAAMRQLANTTAKSAVASHAMRMARMHVGSKAIVAVFCAGIGVALLTMGGGGFAILASTGAFGMAAYTAFDILRVWARLRQVSQAAGKSPGAANRLKSAKAIAAQAGASKKPRPKGKE